MRNYKTLIRLCQVTPALIILLFVPGCAGLIAASEQAPGPIPSPIASAASPDSQAQQTPVTSTEAPEPDILTIWLPPQFDPTAGTPAGDLLQGRLNEFMGLHPGLQIDVRVKAATGEGGLLDMLTTATAAAPLALPDLIALPRDSLETASLKGLLHPLDHLTKTMESPDWYDYAQELARLQKSIYGLPFAGDALLLVYRPSMIAEPPADWEAALTSETTLAFPAADPLALFTLAQYQASGGAISDEQGRPLLDANVLSEVLEFYAAAEQVGVMPYWLTQYQSDDQVWEAFLEKRTDMTVTWSSRYLANSAEDTLIAPLTTPDGEPFSLATGWVWALASPRASHQALSVELAEFLTDSSFLSAWTEAAGFLPPRRSALDGWTNPTNQAGMKPIALSAQLLPPADILTSLGNPLQQATVQVLKKQSDPSSAAQAAAESLTGP